MDNGDVVFVASLGTFLSANRSLIQHVIHDDDSNSASAREVLECYANFADAATSLPREDTVLAELTAVLGEALVMAMAKYKDQCAPALEMLSLIHEDQTSGEKKIKYCVECGERLFES